MVVTLRSVLKGWSKAIILSADTSRIAQMIGKLLLNRSSIFSWRILKLALLRVPGWRCRAMRWMGSIVSARSRGKDLKLGGMDLQVELEVGWVQSSGGVLPAMMLSVSALVLSRFSFAWVRVWERRVPLRPKLPERH
jgi:hypothetical protein